jgi:hypothetical protein
MILKIFLPCNANERLHRDAFLSSIGHPFQFTTKHHQTEGMLLDAVVAEGGSGVDLVIDVDEKKMNYDHREFLKRLAGLG